MSDAQGRSEFPDFPMFVSLRGRRCVVVGGGKIGLRRAETLLRYGAEVTLVSPETARELSHPSLTVLRRAYSKGDLEGAFLAVAATSDREANRRVGLDAAEMGILASVADRAEECTFKFPATAVAGGLSVGLVTLDGDHALAKASAQRIRDLFGGGREG
ncbi:MAG: NAD(P)-dependent oxidoreductase [Candidatus Methanoplasma sp.]|jgi:siroheme synthase-like protein|nr:NAD(P)-dependent oxidoreductase [Candidatus Methanoplasma sp.]